jgi:hypothetical protein
MWNNEKYLNIFCLILFSMDPYIFNFSFFQFLYLFRNTAGMTF